MPGASNGLDRPKLESMEVKLFSLSVRAQAVQAANNNNNNSLFRKLTLLVSQAEFENHSEPSIHSIAAPALTWPLKLGASTG